MCVCMYVYECVRVSTRMYIYQLLGVMLEPTFKISFSLAVGNVVVVSLMTVGYSSTF